MKSYKNKSLSFFWVSLGLLSGCGYHWGFVRPPGIRTVAVQIFDNETYRRGVEFDLTEKLSREIVTRTGFLIETSHKADAILKGKILSIKDLLLLEGGGSTARESAVWITVKADLVQRRTGKMISTITLSDRAEFLTDNDENRTTATRKATSRLAEKIVLGLLLEAELPPGTPPPVISKEQSDLVISKEQSD